MARLTKAHVDGRLEEKLLQRSKSKLLNINELGHLPLGPAGAHLFFQLVSRRHERASMLITSNRPAVSGGKEFGDAVATTANLDRLLYHSQMITIGAAVTGCATSAAAVCCRRPPSPRSSRRVD